VAPGKLSPPIPSLQRREGYLLTHTNWPHFLFNDWYCFCPQLIGLKVANVVDIKKACLPEAAHFCVSWLLQSRIGRKYGCCSGSCLGGNSRKVASVVKLFPLPELAKEMIYVNNQIRITKRISNEDETMYFILNKRGPCALGLMILLQLV
jgi:hypothetical protein